MVNIKMADITHSKTRHHRLLGVFFLAGLVIAGIISYWALFLRAEVESNDAYVSGNIVPVQALVPGIVSRVSVDNSMFVRTGQKLLSEENNLTETTMKKAGAVLAEAVRQTKSLFAQIDVELAEITILETRKKKLEADFERYKIAEPGGATSSQQVSDTRADIAVIGGKIARAEALLRKAKALVAGSSVIGNPLVQKARAKFIESYIRYRRSNLFSPIKGYIADRRVQAGEQVKKGQRLMSIVPLDDLWITANLKETRLEQVRTGQSVKIHAYVYGSDITYHGRVIGIEPSGGSIFSLFPPNNATGNYIHIVERVPVRISLLPAELRSHPLRPGMSVTVIINTHDYRSMPVLVSDVHTSGVSYATPIYENELRAAEHAVDKIVEKNCKI